MSTKSAEKAAKELARSKAGECVRVVVRIRPMSSKEKQDGRMCCAKADEAKSSVSLVNPNADASEPPKSFTFDTVYGPNAQQKVIYDRTASAIVDSVMDGYNGTIFAYGQTGAGKTHTMEGIPDPPELRGIIPNSFKHIFQKIDLNGSDKQYLVRASYLEIYNDEIRDLLSKDPKNRLELKESVDTGVYVKDQKVLIVKSVAEIDQVMQTGKKYRSVGSTLMNQTSSRSHSIFTVIVETSETNPDTGENHIRVGKLNLVDLAGSERQSKTGATGQRLKEATKINMSLSALGNVISALVESKSKHIPYRDSKLTRLLQDSLGGNTKTVMIANCGPADYNFDETMSTLRYANRAKNIKNKPKINEDPKDAMLREFQEEIERLKERLMAAEAGKPMGSMESGGTFAPGARGVEMMDEGKVAEIKEQLAEQSKKEKAQIKREAEERLQKIMAEKDMTEREKKEYEAKALEAAKQAHKAAKAKDQIQKKLKEMETKLLKGVEILDQAALQEEKLRKAELELQERKIQEQRLAEELAAKEEDLSLKEEKFSSMQEEVDVKTKKLKKLWTKYQTVKSETKDLHAEFQQEREDMLDTIRSLTQQLKLKELIIDNFVPPEEVERVNDKSQWNDANGCWTISRIEFSGNQVRPRRPLSHRNARYPESDFGAQKKIHDQGARYKQENVAQLGMDLPERTTQDYDGAAMSQRVEAAVNAALMGEDDQEIEFVAPESLPNFNPYMSYNNDEDGDTRDNYTHKSKSSKSSKSKSKRPGTASRRGRSSKSSSSHAAAASKEIDYLDDDTSYYGSNHVDTDTFAQPEYPSARGLVGRGR